MNRTEHLLVCLAEECAEVQHAIAKALRFGLDDGYPNSAVSNRENIVRELGDVLAVASALKAAGVLDGFENPAAVERKCTRILEWMVYAEQQGTLIKGVRDEQP